MDTTDGTTTGEADSTGSTGDALDCDTPRPAEAPEIGADIVILIDPNTQVAWDALTDGIIAAEQAGANIAVLLTPQQSDEIVDPPCLECEGAGCGSNVRLLKVEYETENALAALGGTDVGCLFHENPLIQRTLHYWLITDDREQTPPSAFPDLVEMSGGRFHVSSSSGSREPLQANLAALVESSFGSTGESDMYDPLREQFRFVGSTRLGCAWPVDPPEDALPLFELHNRFIDFETEADGVFGTPVLSTGLCDDDATDDPGLVGVPFEFHYEEVLGQTFAAACPIACAFLQLEPAEDTELTNLYCYPTDER